MALRQDIKLVISAEDDYSAALRKFNSALGEAGLSASGMSNSADKLNKQMGKLGDVNEYAISGLKRLQGIAAGFAFGAVIGAVSAVTDALISQYKEAVFTREKLDDLNQSVDAAAAKWKLLPDPINAVTKEMINVYNAELKILKLKAPDEIARLGGEIEGLKGKNIRLNESLQRMKAIPGLYNAAATIQAFSLQIALNEKALAKDEEALKKWQARQKESFATLDDVNKAAKEAREALIAPSGTNFLTAFIAGNLDMAAPKLKLAVSSFGGRIGESFTLAGETAAVNFIESTKTTIENAGDRLDFKMSFIKSVSTALTAASYDPAVVAAKGALLDLTTEESRQPLKEAAANSEVARIYYEYDQKLLALQNHNTKKLALMVEAGASEAEIEQTYREMNIEAAEKEKTFKIAAAASAFGAASNLMQNLYVATGKHNRTMFEAQKAFAIAQTTIQTYQGAIAAKAALAVIPVIGPALGEAAYWATLAAGAAAVATIASTQPGGGGAIGAGGTALPANPGGSPEAYPIPQRLEDTRPTQNITLIIQNPLNGQIPDAVAENIVDLLNRNVGNNYKIDARIIER